MLLELVFLLFFSITATYSQCGNGYVDYVNAKKCVKVIRNGKKYTDALIFCMGDAADRHGTLASVHSQAQNDQLAELAFGTNCQDFEVWIGFGYTAGSAGYEWTDGSDIDFLNWAPGNGEEEGEDAGAFLKPNDGKWYSIQTQNSKCFVCEYDRNGPAGTTAAANTGTTHTITGYSPQSTSATITRTATSENPTGIPRTTKAIAVTDCKRKWTLYDGSCYQVVNTKMTFPDAKAYCENESAHLAALKTRSALQFAKGLVGTPQTYPWIGLTKSSSGVWEWFDGEPVNDDMWCHYVNGDVEPDGGGECAVYVDWDQVYQTCVADYGCGNTVKFICEYGGLTGFEIPTYRASFSMVWTLVVLWLF